VKFNLIAPLAIICLFFAMLAFSEIGRRVGRARLAHDPDGLGKGVGAAEGAVFGLLGLLLAFTFSGAASRFETRRHLVADEANVIGTAYLRLDLLAADAQPELRELFRKYVDARLEATRFSGAMDVWKAKLAEGTALQAEIWAKATAAVRRPDAVPQATSFVLSALNEMFDITTTRQMAVLNHPPPIVFALLAGFSLIGALLVGYAGSANSDRNAFHVVMFAVILSFTIYVIVDIEFPRLGLIRVDAADEVLIELRQSME
jgi:hypothetical protein